MKKLTATTILLCLTQLTHATCIDLSGSYYLENLTKDCSIERSGDVLFAQGDFPSIHIMAKPGERYGYFLNQLASNEMSDFDLEQNACEDIQITSNENTEKSYLIQKGIYPYFGARSPINVETKLNEAMLEQKMLITKYTVMSNGEQNIYKDLKFDAYFQLNSHGDLEVETGIRYGKRNKFFEIVKCRFTRR